VPFINSRLSLRAVLSATMEANLNQFRLFTVRGEQEANTRRGSCNGRGRHPHEGNRGLSSDAASSLAGSNGSVNDSVFQSAAHDHDRHITDDSAPSADSSPQCRPRSSTGRDPTDQQPEAGYSDDGDVEVSDDEDDEKTQLNGHKSSNAELSLVNALRSLEATLNDHTLQLTKRLRREFTAKGTSNETQAAVGASPLPAKTGQRGDKVEL